MSHAVTKHKSYSCTMQAKKEVSPMAISVTSVRKVFWPSLVNRMSQRNEHISSVGEVCEYTPPKRRRRAMSKEAAVDKVKWLAGDNSPIWF